MTPAPTAPADPLEGFRAAVVSAEANKGVLAVEIAQAQLAVAEEYHAAGENVAHQVDAILATGQQRVIEQLRQAQTPPAAPPRQPAPIERAAAAISDEDRKRGDVLASQAVREFRGLATKRKGKMQGYKDGQSDWAALPGDLRERIERFNTMPKDRQDAELATMQRKLAGDYARDPTAAARDRQSHNRGRDRER